MARFKLFLPLLLAIGIGIALYFGLKTDPHQLGLAQQNKPLPTFSVADLQHSKRKITSEEFKGHITLLNVWASWCPACKTEHPYLMQLSMLDNVRLYGLNYRDERKPALSLLSELGNPYQSIIFDPDGKLAFELGVYGSPETYLIDPEGIVRYRYAGILDERVWLKEFLPRIQAIEQGELVL